MSLTLLFEFNVVIGRYDIWHYPSFIIDGKEFHYAELFDGVNQEAGKKENNGVNRPTKTVEKPPVWSPENEKPKLSNLSLRFSVWNFSVEKATSVVWRFRKPDENAAARHEPTGVQCAVPRD